MRKINSLIFVLLTALCTLPLGSSSAADGGHEARLLEHARKLVAERRYSEAIKVSTNLTGLNPVSSEAYYQRGLAESYLDLFEDALRDFEKGEKLSPCQNPIVFRQASYCYTALGQFKKALDATEQEIRLKRTAKALRVKGELLVTLKQLPAALAIFKDALRLAPDEYWLVDDKLSCLATMGMYREAIADAGHLIKLRPREVRGYNIRAQLYKKTGQRALADADLQKANTLAKQADSLEESLRP